MSIDILPSLPEPDARSGRLSPLRLVLSGVVIVLVLALIGGVTVAVRGLSGGGSQPEDVLPSGAFAFAKVDLDPSAGQKINALRFLRKFPALKDKVSLDADLREALFEGVADSAGWGDLDFDEDVAPWLGSRVAVAAYTSTEEDNTGGDAGSDPITGPDHESGMSGPIPTMVVALQVTDAEKARAGLSKLAAAAEGSPDPGVVITNGYALLAPDQKGADKAARDAQAGVLADDDHFSTDLAALGDGVASAWVDMDGVNALAGGLTGIAGLSGAGIGGLNPASTGAGGRTAYVLRFDGADALEVRGAVTGATSGFGSDRTLTGFGDLPEGSLAAFGLADGESMVSGFFDALREVFDDQGASANGPEGGFDAMVADAERELGIELPEDVAVLLGSNLVGALHQGSAGDDVELGARVTTDGRRAMSVIDKLIEAARASGEALPVERRLTNDGVVVASTGEQLERLTQDGRLGDRAEVRAALPDLDDATAALWIDVRGLVTRFSDDGSVDENVEPIDGLGMTLDMDADGAATYRLRLVVH